MTQRTDGIIALLSAATVVALVGCRAPFRFLPAPELAGPAAPTRMVSQETSAPTSAATEPARLASATMAPAEGSTQPEAAADAAMPRSAATDAPIAGGGAEARSAEPLSGEPGERPAAAPALAGYRPADMLSPAEAQQALALALGNGVVSDFIAASVDRDEPPDAAGTTDAAALAGQPSYRVLYAERAPDKDSSSRAAEVAIYRYDTAQAVVTRVDLATGEVSRRELPPGYPLPLVPAEIAEAASVARRSTEVRDALQQSGFDPDATGANGLLTGTVDSDSPCAVHRCVRLFFSTFRQPVPSLSVIVDLVALEVIEVTPMPEGVTP